MSSVIISTVFLAAVYALVAVGISLTWAGLGFLNLAHGVTYATGAYGAWWAAEHISTNLFVVILGGMVAGGLLGLVTYLLVFLPLDGRRNFDVRTMIATLALAYIVENTLLDRFGPEFKTFKSIFGNFPKLELSGKTVTENQTGAVVAAIVVVGLFVLFLEGSRIGLGVRALTQNVEGARLVGIDRRTAAIAILVASGLLVGLAAVPPARLLRRPLGRLPADDQGPHGRDAGRARLDPRRRHRGGARGGGRGAHGAVHRAETRARRALPPDRDRAARAAARHRRRPGDHPCLRASSSGSSRASRPS